MVMHLQQQSINQRLLACNICLKFFTLICMAFSLLLSSVVQAAPLAKKQPAACQHAQQNIQAHLQKANAIRDKEVVFSKMDNLPRAEVDIAYLQVERELLLLAKKGVLHQCDFSALSRVGLEQVVSDDGTFRVYRWVTDIEVPHSKGYATVMYAQPKPSQVHSAEYVNRQRYAEVSQVITIAKPVLKPMSQPASKSTSTSKSKHATVNEMDFPIYGVVERDFSRGQHRIHCEPSLSLFRIEQREHFAYIDDINFKFLDANGKKIDTRPLFANGCDGDDSTKQYIADNQFRYDAKTQVLSFRLSVMTDFDEEMLSGKYGYKHYRFRFNGKDFVQITTNTRSSSSQQNKKVTN